MLVELEEQIINVEEKPKAQRWSWTQRGQRWAGEGLGVFAIVFAAGGTTIGGQAGLVGAALVSGLAVMAMIYALGHICGAHFNPAVTLAFALTRHFPLKEIPGYIGVQLTGAVLAATTLKLLFGEQGQTVRLGANVPAGSAVQSLVMEVIISFFLMLVIMAVATDNRAAGQTAAIAIGVTVTFAILVGGPVSGGSMNPARSFGPALLSNSWQDHWVYWVGPISGTVLGALAYKLVRGEGSYKHER